eukprot:842218-Pyramimonas_sp.AAC.1
MAKRNLKPLQELHGLRAIPFQYVALALAPRTFVYIMVKSVTDSHHQRTRKCVLDGFRIMWAQQLRVFSVGGRGMDGILERFRIVKTQQSG